MARWTRTLTSTILLAAAGMFPAPAAGQAPPIPLDTIWIVGDRASYGLPVVTRGIEVIGPDMLENAPARSLGDLLTWALGIEIVSRSSGHAEASVRGSTAKQVLILVDGMRVSDAPAGPHAADLIVPVDDIERIEILRGPSSTAFGTDAVGGVVNVITRRRAPPGITARIEAGSFNSLGSEASGRIGGERSHLALAAEHRRSDGHREGTDFESIHLRASGRLGVGGHGLRGRVAAAAREFGAAGFYAPYPPFDAYQEARTLEAGLAWEAPTGARLAVEPRVRLQLDEDEFLLQRQNPSYFLNLHESRRFGGEMTARYLVTESTRFQAGVEHYRDRLESSNRGLPGGGCSVVRRCRLHESRAGAFLEAAAGSIGNAAFTAGVRADWHSAFGTYVAPGISAAIWPGDGLRLRAASGWTQRVPTWSERFYRDSANVGSPDLLPERGWSAELGGDLMVSPSFRFGFAGFMRRVDDLIDWVRVVEPAPENGEDSIAAPPPSAASQPWVAANIEEATFDGLEVDLTIVHLFGARITARAAGVTYTATNLESFSSKLAFRPLTRIASLVVDRQVARHGMVSGRILNGRRKGERGYTRFDARLTYRIGGRADVYVDAVNLTDTRYLDITASPAPGRAFFLGVNVGWSPS